MDLSALESIKDLPVVFSPERRGGEDARKLAVHLLALLGGKHVFEVGPYAGHHVARSDRRFDDKTMDMLDTLCRGLVCVYKSEEGDAAAIAWTQQNNFIDQIKQNYEKAQNLEDGLWLVDGLASNPVPPDTRGFETSLTRSENAILNWANGYADLKNQDARLGAYFQRIGPGRDADGEDRQESALEYKKFVVDRFGKFFSGPEKFKPAEQEPIGVGVEHTALSADLEEPVKEALDVVEALDDLFEKDTLSVFPEMEECSTTKECTEALVATVTALATSVRDLQNTYEEQCGSIRGCRGQLGKLEEAIKRSVVSEMAPQIDDARRKLEAYKAEATNENAQMSEWLDEIQENLEQCEEARADLEAKNESLESEAEEAKISIEGLESAADSAINELRDLRERTDELELLNGVHEATLLENQRDMDELERTVRIRDDLLDSANLRGEDLQKRIERLNILSVEAQERHERLKRESSARASESADKIKTLEGERAIHVASMDRLREANAEATRAAGELEERGNYHLETADGLREDLVRLEQEHSEALGTVDERNAELAGLQEMIDTLDEERRGLLGELEGSSAALDECAQLAEAYANLENELRNAVQTQEENEEAFENEVRQQNDMREELVAAHRAVQEGLRERIIQLERDVENRDGVIERQKEEIRRLTLRLRECEADRARDADVATNLLAQGQMQVKKLQVQLEERDEREERFRQYKEETLEQLRSFEAERLEIANILTEALETANQLQTELEAKQRENADLAAKLLDKEESFAGMLAREIDGENAGFYQPAPVSERMLVGLKDGVTDLGYLDARNHVYASDIARAVDEVFVGNSVRAIGADTDYRAIYSDSASDTDMEDTEPDPWLWGDSMELDPQPERDSMETDLESEDSDVELGTIDVDDIFQQLTDVGEENFLSDVNLDRPEDYVNLNFIDNILGEGDDSMDTDSRPEGRQPLRGGGTLAMKREGRIYEERPSKKMRVESNDSQSRGFYFVLVGPPPPEIPRDLKWMKANCPLVVVARSDTEAQEKLTHFLLFDLSFKIAELDNTQLDLMGIPAESTLKWAIPREDVRAQGQAYSEADSDMSLIRSMILIHDAFRTAETEDVFFPTWQVSEIMKGIPTDARRRDEDAKGRKLVCTGEVLPSNKEVPPQGLFRDDSDSEIKQYTALTVSCLEQVVSCKLDRVETGARLLTQKRLRDFKIDRTRLKNIYMGLLLDIRSVDNFSKYEDVENGTKSVLDDLADLFGELMRVFWTCDDGGANTFVTGGRASHPLSVLSSFLTSGESCVSLNTETAKDIDQKIENLAKRVHEDQSNGTPQDIRKEMSEIVSSLVVRKNIKRFRRKRVDPSGDEFAAKFNKTCHSFESSWVEDEPYFTRDPFCQDESSVEAFRKTMLLGPLDEGVKKRYKAITDKRLEDAHKNLSLFRMYANKNVPPELFSAMILGRRKLFRSPDATNGVSGAAQTELEPVGFSGMILHKGVLYHAHKPAQVLSDNEKEIPDSYHPSLRGGTTIGLYRPPTLEKARYVLNKIIHLKFFLRLCGKTGGNEVKARFLFGRCGFDLRLPPEINVVKDSDDDYRVGYPSHHHKKKGTFLLGLPSDCCLYADGEIATFSVSYGKIKRTMKSLSDAVSGFTLGSSFLLGSDRVLPGLLEGRGVSAITKGRGRRNESDRQPFARKFFDFNPNLLRLNSLPRSVGMSDNEFGFVRRPLQQNDPEAVALAQQRMEEAEQRMHQLDTLTGTLNEGQTQTQARKTAARDYLSAKKKLLSVLYDHWSDAEKAGAHLDRVSSGLQDIMGNISNEGCIPSGGGSGNFDVLLCKQLERDAQISDLGNKVMRLLYPSIKGKLSQWSYLYKDPESDALENAMTTIEKDIRSQISCFVERCTSNFQSLYHNPESMGAREEEFKWKELHYQVVVFTRFCEIEDDGDTKEGRLWKNLQKCYDHVEKTGENIQDGAIRKAVRWEKDTKGGLRPKVDPPLDNNTDFKKAMDRFKKLTKEEGLHVDPPIKTRMGLVVSTSMGYLLFEPRPPGSNHLFDDTVASRAFYPQPQASNKLHVGADAVYGIHAQYYISGCRGLVSHDIFGDIGSGENRKNVARKRPDLYYDVFSRLTQTEILGAEDDNVLNGIENECQNVLARGHMSDYSPWFHDTMRMGVTKRLRLLCGGVKERGQDLFNYLANPRNHFTIYNDYEYRKRACEFILTLLFGFAPYALATLCSATKDPANMTRVLFNAFSEHPASRRAEFRALKQFMYGDDRDAMGIPFPMLAEMASCYQFCDFCRSNYKETPPVSLSPYFPFGPGFAVPDVLKKDFSTGRLTLGAMKFVREFGGGYSRQLVDESERSRDVAISLLLAGLRCDNRREYRDLAKGRLFKDDDTFPKKWSYILDASQVVSAGDINVGVATMALLCTLSRDKDGEDFKMYRGLLDGTAGLSYLSDREDDMEQADPTIYLNNRLLLEEIQGRITINKEFVIRRTDDAFSKFFDGDNTNPENKDFYTSVCAENEDIAKHLIITEGNPSELAQRYLRNSLPIPRLIPSRFGTLQILNLATKFDNINKMGIKEEDTWKLLRLLKSDLVMCAARNFLLREIPDEVSLEMRGYAWSVLFGRNDRHGAEIPPGFLPEIIFDSQSAGDLVFNQLSGGIISDFEALKSTEVLLSEQESELKLSAATWTVDKEDTPQSNNLLTNSEDSDDDSDDSQSSEDSHVVDLIMRGSIRY